MKRAVFSLLFLAIGLGHAQSKHVVQPSDLLDLKSVNDPQISPDGSKTLFVVGTPSATKRSSHIWIVDGEESGTQRPFLFSGGDDTSPRWSPDGRSVAFLSTRPNGLAKDSMGAFRFSIADNAKSFVSDKESTAPANEAQIWLLRLGQGEPEPLTGIPGGVKSIRWMPDGKSIAFLRRDPAPVDDVERRKAKKDWNIALENSVFDRLWLYDLATKQARLVTPQNINIDDYSPSPDGSQFLVKTSPTPLLNDFFFVNRVAIIDASTGKEQKLISNDGAFTGQWSPDGKRFVFQVRTGKSIAASAVIYDVATGKQTPIKQPTPSTLASAVWTADGKGLVALTEENTHAVLQTVDLSTGLAKTTQVLGGVGLRLTMSDDGNAIAYICSTPNHPGEVCYARGGKARVLTEFNPQVSSWSLGKSDEVSWKSTKDGLVVHGLLVYPADYVQGKRYKTIVHLHGGPDENWLNGWNGSWYNPAQFYASHGFAVFLPVIRGSGGNGPEFLQMTYKNWGDADLPDILDGVDSIIAKGVADPEKLVIGGWSYGGYSTAWAITHTQRFKAAVVGAGISDLFTMGLTTDITPSYLDQHFGPVLANKNLYEAHSAINYLDRVTTPTLIVHGESDQRVPVSQAYELFNGLRLSGHDVHMVTYPREPHIFTEREHQVDSLSRMLQWYESHTGN